MRKNSKKLLLPKSEKIQYGREKLIQLNMRHLTGSAGHLVGDHLLPDEFLVQLSEQFPPGGADALTGGQKLLQHTVQSEHINV